VSRSPSKEQKESVTDADNAELAAVILDLRKELGLTQVQFAAEVDLTPTSIYRYEAGTNTPTNDILAKMLQLAVKKQSLAGVQNLAEHLAKRTGLSLFGSNPSLSDAPFVRAISGLRLERRILIMAAVMMEKEASDETALRVFEGLVKPWIEKATDTFGPLDVSFNAEGTSAKKGVRAEVRAKEK
jgi:transcriptional regulator with XRE-family HTH domain